MKRVNITIFIISLITLNSYGQASNGKVSSLVAAENYFAAFTKQNGIRSGFLKVSDDETLVFRPAPVRAKVFYEKKQEDPGELTWRPTFAKISRGGDWGFTTGPYMYTAKNDGAKLYGEYFSIWRANGKGVWKLALDIGSPHPKPATDVALNFTDPKVTKFFRQISPVRLKQREDMIMTNDRLFSSTLTKNTALGYNTFLGENSRLIFPGFEPVIGKENIAKFLDKQGISVFTEPIAANRAIGSDLAYTYGTAQVTTSTKTAKYNYVRVWESQEGFEWNVIVELFSPAEQ